MKNLEVLYEDNHCLAVNKPAGLLSQGDASGEPSLVDVAAQYLRTQYAKPGNVYVGLVHRLDRPTSGAIVLARTSKAAGRLSAQFRDGMIAKVYWAIVEGAPLEPEGEWVDISRERRSEKPLRASCSKKAKVEQRSRGVAFRVLKRSRRKLFAKLEETAARNRSEVTSFVSSLPGAVCPSLAIGSMARKAR